MTDLEQQALHKEIDLIQNCITRMSHNSFLIKGWLISLIAVTSAIKGNDIENLLWIMCFVIIAFWYLDAFFLHTEKLYRKKYDWVIEKRRNGILYWQYNLTPDLFSENSDIFSIILTMKNRTLSSFYIPVLAIIFVFLGGIDYAKSFL